jgi:hypothetical protein
MNLLYVQMTNGSQRLPRVDEAATLALATGE